MISSVAEASVTLRVATPMESSWVLPSMVDPTVKVIAPVGAMGPDQPTTEIRVIWRGLLGSVAELERAVVVGRSCTPSIRLDEVLEKFSASPA